MNKYILILLSVLLCSRAIKAECYNDSFGIQSSSVLVSTDIFNMSYSIYSKIQNDTEYLNECLEYVEVEFFTQHSECYYRNYINSENMNKTFNFTQNLTPLTEYSISLVYKVVNITKKFFLIGANWTTCLGNPDAPTDLKVNKKDQLLSLEWKKPLVSNSPYICYYKVMRQFLGQSQIDEYIVKETKFNFSGDDLKRDFQIDIYAFNDVSCYIDDYPVAKYCAAIGQNTTGGISVRYLYRSEPDTTTTIKQTTTTSENNAIICKLNLIYLFFVILLNFYLN